MSTLISSHESTAAQIASQTQCDYCHLPMPEQRGSHDQEAVYCCYGCQFAAAVTGASGEAAQTGWMLTRLGVSTFLTMGVMVFTLYLYSQDVYATAADSERALQQNLGALMRYLSLIFATPVLFLLGWPILRNAQDQFARRVYSADALIVLGVAAAYLTSYVSTLSGSGPTYYETACMVLVLFTFGRWLEANCKLKAADVVQSLDGLIEPTTRVVDGTQVKTKDIHADQVIVVPAGQHIPVDGLIHKGAALVDTRLLTGESRPQFMREEDPVSAGAIPIDGSLIIRATQSYAHSTLGQFSRLLESARKLKGQWERLTDHVARVFVPAIVAIAVIGCGIGLQRGGAGEGIMTLLSVLLIACPCALGMATPLAIWVTLGRAIRHGVVFQSPQALEAFAQVDTFCFDKTGTLTTHEPTVISSFVDRHCDLSEDRALAIAAGLVAHSHHLYSQAISSFARRCGVDATKIEHISIIAGLGIQGHGHGYRAMIGSARLLEHHGISASDDISNFAVGCENLGHSVVYLSIDDKAIAAWALNEMPRTGAAEALAELSELGCHVVGLTGDHRQRAQQLGAQLGVDMRWALKPQDKIAHLSKLRNQGAVVSMVGDGLNDAPALAAADVSVALACGADLSRDTADCCLINDDLATLPWLVRLARAMIKTIKVNLFWAFFYNVIGIGLALMGLLSPILAAMAMVLSSVCLIANTMRLSRVNLEAKA